jgi:hypothetical protein
MALDKETIKEFRLAIADKNMAEDEKDFFKDALDKEGISYTETETEVVEKKKTATKKAKATRKKTKEKKEKKEFDLTEAKKDLKQKFGKTEEECEKIIQEYKKAREKAKVGRKKRTSTLKKKGKLIKGTDVKDAGATLDTAKTQVKKKIEKEIKKVEDKEEAKVKQEVKQEVKEQAKTKKPKAQQKKAVKKVEEKEKKKAEKEVKEKTKKIAQKVSIDTSGIISAINTSLANFDKNSSKEFLTKLRKDIDKLLAKYDAGGFTQTLNITQSNMSASSVNPSQFKRGGKVNVEKELRKIKEYFEKNGDVEFFGQKYKKRGGDIEFFGQKFMAKGGKTQPMDKKLYNRFNKVMVGYHKDIGIPIKSLMDAYSKGKAPLTREQQNKLTKRLQKEHPQIAEDLGMKFKKGGDVEFFGQMFKKKGGIVDKFSDAYNDLVKELGFKKRGGDIEFFGTKYKKKGGVVEKFNKAYKDLVKELGFKRGGDVDYFGQKYKARGGGIRKFKQGYNDRDDESLGARRGSRRGMKQDYRARRNESKGELRHKMRRAYSDVGSMDRGDRMYLKRGGDVDFFGQKFKKRGGDVDYFGQKYKRMGGDVKFFGRDYKKRGGDVDYFGQKYKADGGQIDFDSVVDTGQPHEMMRMGGKTKNKNWIQSVVDSPNFRKGAFTKKAKARGMNPEEFMKKVLSNPSQYDERTRRQAQFMKNI